jgi:hypothetical protein
MYWKRGCRLTRLSFPLCCNVDLPPVAFRPKVRHAGIPSTCHPTIVRAADATECVVVSQSSMSCVVPPHIVSTDVALSSVPCNVPLRHGARRMPPRALVHTALPAGRRAADGPEVGRQD